jgi:hypothetical protein
MAAPTTRFALRDDSLDLRSRAFWPRNARRSYSCSRPRGAGDRSHYKLAHRVSRLALVLQGIRRRSQRRVAGPDGTVHSPVAPRPVTVTKGQHQ